jgi:hypothetical protein
MGMGIEWSRWTCSRYTLHADGIITVKSLDIINVWQINKKTSPWVHNCGSLGDKWIQTSSSRVCSITTTKKTVLEIAKIYTEFEA